MKSKVILRSPFRPMRILIKPGSKLIVCWVKVKVKGFKPSLTVHTLLKVGEWWLNREKLRNILLTSWLLALWSNLFFFFFLQISWIKWNSISACRDIFSCIKAATLVNKLHFFHEKIQNYFKKLKHFIWVWMYLARKYLLGTLFLRLLRETEKTETGTPFYGVIRATRRSSHLQSKGSTFMSQLF